MRAKLSVCMIVKNEEDNLGRCLSSIRDIADEIIVVDTGSEDKTKAIAKHYGALVFDFLWVDDFSKARNYSIEQATGDWILILDGDDEFETKDSQKLLDIINDKNAGDIYIFNTVCYTDTKSSSDKIMNVNIRLFRNEPVYRYQGMIHESITTPNENVRVFTSDITIYHYGYIDKNVVSHNKRERNMRILKKQLEESPDSPYFIFCMANEYYALHEFNKALEYYLSAYDKCKKTEVYVSKLLIRIVMTYIEINELDNAINYINEGLRMYPKLTDMEFLRGTIYHKLGYLTKAVASFQKCIEMGEPNAYISFLIGSGTYKAYHALGFIHEQMRDYNEALKNYNQVILIKSDFHDAVYAIGRIVTIVYKTEDKIKSAFESFFDINDKCSLFMMADIMFVERQYALAYEYGKAAINKGIISAELNYLIGRCLFYMNRFDDSLNILQSIDTESGFYINAKTLMCIIYLLEENQKQAYEVLESLKPHGFYESKIFIVYNKLYEIFNGESNKDIECDSEKNLEYLKIIIDILDMILTVKDYDKFQTALELLNCIDSHEVLLELAKLYNRHDRIAMAVLEIKRSIKLFDKIDEECAFILYKSFSFLKQ